MDIQEMVDSVHESLSRLEDVQLRVEEIINTAEDVNDRVGQTMEALQEDIELLERIEINLAEAASLEEDANNII